eukprot:scaffold24568_cov70-Phaeocystis_antarctica.AAC.11
MARSRVYNSQRVLFRILVVELVLIGVSRASRVDPAQEQYGQSPPKNLKVEPDPTELGTMRS